MRQFLITLLTLCFITVTGSAFAENILRFNGATNSWERIDETESAVTKVSTRGASSRILGPTSGLDKTLVSRLLKLSKHFKTPITITPHGGCRKHGSRGAPRSFHRRSVGCKAADIIVPGYTSSRGRNAVLSYWAKTGGGGRGYYCRRNFVHVDVGPSRTWRWFCR